MGTFQSWRKAVGALKDTTTVSIAKVNSEYKDLDVAIVKATNHVERPPKDHHIRKIFVATTANRPRADVAYCVHSLARRLAKTRNWVVALKTLIVMHRTLREGDTTFRDELLHFSHNAHILHISNFKDDSSALAWDCSAWVRTYALFLEERLECYRILRYDIETERLRKSVDEHSKGHCRTRSLDSHELLEQLPALQQLLFRLVCCQPEGGAFGNYLIQYALALILKESFKIYCALNDGIINLVDLFFEMSKHDATKALDIYKRAGKLAANLSEFYELCKGLEMARNFQFPTLREPPPSFLPTMEEYIREAPRVGSLSVSNTTLECPERNISNYKKEEPSPSAIVENPIVEEPEPSPTMLEDIPQPATETEPVAEVATQPPETVDLLGLDEVNTIASELEENNALALAIVPPGGHNKSTIITGVGSDPSGWELALVTTPSNNANLFPESKLAGGFDKLLLDSLYDDAARRQHNTGTSDNELPANAFGIVDPFALSNNIPPPPNVQMALMVQQQQQQYYQQQNMMMIQPPYQSYYSQTQAASANPFVGFQAAPLQGSSSLI